MSGSNNLPVSYSHWKSNLSLIGSSSVAAAAAAAATSYQNIIKMANPSVSSPGFMHQHHSPQLSEDHLIPAHSSHSPHSMSRIIGSPGSSTSLYSPGSNASSSAGCSMPTIIPRAHQHNMPPAPAHIQSSPSSFIDSHGHHIDIYSQIGMQRISQMYKANLAANNNNSNCNNKNAKTNSIEKAEQSMNNIKQLVEGAIGHDAKQQIMHILEKISLLQPPERLLLYLRMPSSTSETDPLRQPQNPLGTRSEINFTINWVRSHLEMDPNVSIPKQDVYDEYATYCAREDVKPLSTADFGKVMKQIFPSVRPRRLGTRGNSRYCYAAMRKTTRLECPQLPNLCDSKNTGQLSGSDRLSAAIDDDDNDEDTIGSLGTWKVIRNWAESLLNTEFKNANELAKHITANYLNGNSAAISNSSRALLQKKLLQRKVKGRKKKSMSTSEQELIEGKKRRKKKLKKSNSEQLDDNHSPGSGSGNGSVSIANDLNVPEMLKIKQEQKHSTDGPGSMESQHDLSPGTQQTVPINLTNEHGKLKSEIDSHGYSSNASEPMEMHDYASTVCKIEIDEAADVEQAICCKKVRAAQESKGFAVPSPKMPQHSPDPRIPNLSPASMLMRPPACDSSMIGTISEPTNLSGNPELNSIESSASSSTNTNSLQLPNKRAAQNISGRVKRLRFRKHESVAGMNETKVDDISTDIIIPRERVVSICNMDKDALDDYLNEGGDSQEPEAELLQYFQPGKTSGNEKMPSNVTTDTVAGNNLAAVVSVTESVSTTQAFPLLENYELHQQNIAANAAAMPSETQPIPTNAAATPKQINALRQYLQQNLHQSSTGVSNSSISSAAVVDVGIVSSRNGQSNINQMPTNSLNATQSITTLSMPYQQTNDSTSQNQTVANLMDRIIEMQKTQPPPLIRSTSHPTSSVIQSQIEQSPNSRCNKNFSFVPISPRPQSPRIQSNQLPANVQALHGRNTFLSPRQSPAIRKTINKELTNCLKQLQDPSISTYDTGYIAKNEISASAPVSPSITPHHFQFNKSHGSGYGGTSSSGQMLRNQVGQQQSAHQQHSQSHQHQATCSISGMCPVLERSQSVPLHCQSPAFNAPPISSTAYNSVCNSIAPTPVPSEYADFNEDNLLDMLTESSSSNEKSIKIESNELSNMMTNNQHIIISRSVPSTPLPMNPYQLNAINNFGNASATSTSTSGLLMTCKTSSFDASKSVPSTPNPLTGHNNSTPFRYSPEHSPDFLLNGNVVDVTKSTQFYAVAQTSSSHTSPQGSQGIQQHPSISSTQSNAQILLASTTQPMDNNNLSHYNDVGDPIIAGSNLMNDM